MRISSSKMRFHRLDLFALCWFLLIHKSNTLHQEVKSQRFVRNNQNVDQDHNKPLINGLSLENFERLASISSRGELILPSNNNNLATVYHGSYERPTLLSHQPVSYPTRATASPVLPSLEQSKVRVQKPGSSVSFYDANSDVTLHQTNLDEGSLQQEQFVGPIGNLRSNQWTSSGLPLQRRDSELPQHDPESISRLEMDDKKSTHMTTTTSTTEQSNTIIISGDLNQSVEKFHHANDPNDFGRDPSLNKEIVVQNEYLSSSLSSPATITSTSTSLPMNSSAQNQINSNNVFYEGPATVPPSGDFYFSSSERLPDHEKSSNLWWAIGLGYEFDRASNLTRDDYMDYCANSPLLISGKQRSLCKSHPKVMAIVARGLKMAIEECQSRFSNSRWNCSLMLDDINQFSNDQVARPVNFGQVIKNPNRERSFLNAIVAAGLAHAMTKACSAGELPEECSCDKMIRPRSQRNKIEWVACSDDIDFGAKFSRDFTDISDSDSDTSSMINTHNYEVGRRVFKSSTDITCTCMDDSEGGLCQTKKCWKHLGPFRDIGDELMRRYESATHVQLSSRDPHKLRPVRRGVRKPKRKDLVYIDESPDYCSPNPRIGVLGTQNRKCNSTSSGPDSCSLLCCGRGYQIVVEEIEDDCNCKFVWCCEVKCEKCRRQISNDICN